MKQADPRISAHVRSEVTTLCTCWKLTRLDGVVRTWTDHDEPIDFQGERYEAASDGGFDRAALESALSMDVSNTEMIGFLGAGLDRAELNAGLYDGASLVVMLVNWADPTMGAIALRAGTLGEVTLSDTDLYKVELRGLQQPYKQVIGEVYSPECRANFGDARCGLSLADYTTAPATIETVTSRQIFTLASGTSFATAREVPEGQWEVGVVRFMSGANAGKTIEIKQIKGMVVTLKFAAPNRIEPGDEVELVAGCDHHYETCKAYGNMVNFRGENFLPGQAAVFKVVGRR